MSAEIILRLAGVSQQYGHGETAVSALSGIDLEVRRGEMVAVMGASGSGKSTLLSVAGGLATPTSGEVIIEGEHLSDQTPAHVARLRRRSLVIGLPLAIAAVSWLVPPRAPDLTRRTAIA